MSRRKPKPKVNILIKNPPITSQAAYYHLIGKLAEEAGERPFLWWEWVAFRVNYLTELERLYGMLWCEYCGKHPLQINGDLYSNQCLATLDHIQAVANGGSIYDKNNLAVACHSCNQEKDSEMGYFPRLYPYTQETIALLERSMYVESVTKSGSW